MAINISPKVKDDGILCDIKKERRRARIKIKSKKQYLLFKSILKYLEEDEVNIDLENTDLVKKVIMAKIYHDKGSQFQNDEFELVFNKAITAYNKLDSIEVILDDDKEILEKKIKIKKDDILRILLLGGFGVGKSSLIKSLTDIGDEEDIPAIDTSRTTTYETTYVLKNRRENSEFSFVVLFKKKFEIYSDVEECVLRGIYGITERMIEGSVEVDDKVLQEYVIKKFISDPKNSFKIQYILGKYYTKGKAGKEEQLVFWDFIYTSLLKLVSTIFKNKYEVNRLEEVNFSGISLIKLQDDILEGLQNDEKASALYNEIIEDVLEKLTEKKGSICEQMESNGLGEVIRDEHKEIIAIYKASYDPDNISHYLKPFTSISSKDFTRIITPLVKEIRIEVPYNECINSEIKKNTIAITDTVGFEHIKQNDTNSLSGSVDINYTDFDIIAIFDTATHSMNSTTERILADVYRTVIKDKIMLAYSHYDEFTKKDFEDEQDKENYLLDLQDTTLKKIANDNTMCDFSKELRNRTIYLQNMNRKDNNELNNESLNKFLETAINQSKFIHDIRRIKLINDKKPLIDFYYHKLFIVYNTTKNEFIKQQNDIYNVKIPPYQTTKALTNQLRIGKSKFSGETMELKPIDDFMSIITQQLDKFFRNPKNINFEPKKDVEIPNYIEKVEDWIKEESINRLKDVVKERVIFRQHKFWENLYKYAGDKSDKKRRAGIMMLYNSLFPCLDLSNISLGDYWIKKIEEIINESLDEIISELK